MSLVKWDPLREFENLFDRYSRTVGWPRLGSQEEIKAVDWAPRVDIAEDEEAFIIKAEIPEVKKEDVKVTRENNVLTIQGVRNQEKENKNKKIHRIERFYGSFSRSFTLPDNADANKVVAIFKDGMLRLSIPKLAEPQTSSIEIKVQ